MSRNPLLPRARSLRQSMTKPEVLLWLALREMRPLGFRFRRQVPLAGYIVDFACFARRIVIEVDGFQHGFDDHAEKDAARDARLAEAGFMVLRFTNAEVLENRAGVIETIMARASEVSPSPMLRIDPPRKGEGGEAGPATGTSVSGGTSP